MFAVAPVVVRTVAGGRKLVPEIYLDRVVIGSDHSCDHSGRIRLTDLYPSVLEIANTPLKGGFRTQLKY